MDLELSEEQRIFRDASVRFMTKERPLEVVRAGLEINDPLDREFHRRSAELGWFAMFVPEVLGGGSVSGSAVLDAAIIAEDRGANLQPGGFIGTNAAAAGLAAGRPDAVGHDVLAQVAAGVERLAWVAGDAWGNGLPGAGVRYFPAGDGGFVLDGASGLVDGARDAEWLLITATGDRGVAQFLVSGDHAGVSVEALNCLDLTQRVDRVVVDRLQLGADSLVSVDDSVVARQLDVALALIVAETVGAMEHLFEMTRQYALDRVAFGRPIGSFQAIKHILADLSTSVETSKSVAAAAARAVQAEVPYSSEVASIAKAYVSEHAVTVAQGCLQVHAGIGCTWEHDLHLYLRRLTFNGSAYGDAALHRERICALHGL